jgi:hypothetical protein
MLVLAEMMRVDSAADTVGGLEDFVFESRDCEMLQQHGCIESTYTCADNTDFQWGNRIRSARNGRY